MPAIVVFVQYFGLRLHDDDDDPPDPPRVAEAIHSAGSSERKEWELCSQSTYGTTSSLL